MKLAELTTTELHALLAGDRPVVALLPIGSTEPHGPHLPLATDVLISAAACERAVPVLNDAGVAAVVAPAISYGVTDCAAGFAGAVTVPGDVLTAYLGAIVDSLLSQGFAQVCLVNNHLEPAHDAAVRATTIGRPKVAVACPLTRRWARTLSDEFKSGACHAGEYETGLVLAVAPTLVNESARGQLADVAVSLSQQLRGGVTTFAAMGLDRAYTGRPQQATKDHGDQQLARLTDMVVAEVLELLRA